jgi:hypothetical protein
MDDQEISKFYLTWMFLVTGFSFLLFSFFLSIVEGVNNKLFLRIGLINFILALLAGVLTWRNLTIKKKQKKRSFTIAENGLL